MHDDIWMLVRRKEQTDRQTDVYKYRQTGRQTNRRIGIWMKKMDRQMEGENGQTDGRREWTDRWKKRMDRQVEEENEQTCGRREWTDRMKKRMDRQNEEENG